MKIVEKLGHKIIGLVPSLFMFNIKDELLKDLSRTSFKNTEISIPKLKTKESRPLLITHWGLSGPAVLKISAWEAISLAKLQYNFEIEVNFISIEINEAKETFLHFKQSNPKKTIGQSKIFNITKRFWRNILNISNVDLNKQLVNISEREIQKILDNLCRKDFR